MGGRFMVGAAGGCLVTNQDISQRPPTGCDAAVLSMSGVRFSIGMTQTLFRLTVVKSRRSRCNPPPEGDTRRSH